MTGNSDMPAPLLAQSVEQMLAGLAEKRKAASRVEPGKSIALVVVDMQYFFLPDGDPAIDAALTAVRRLADHARSLSIPVVLIRNVFDRPEQINPFWMMRMGRPFILRSDPSSQLHDRLGRVDSDIVVDKPHASAFTGSTLHDQLSIRGIDTLLVTGTLTHACVRATVVEGAARHYRMMVVEEGTYDRDPISGAVALYDMANGYGNVIALDEAITLLDQQAGAT